MVMQRRDLVAIILVFGGPLLGGFTRLLGGFSEASGGAAGLIVLFTGVRLFTAIFLHADGHAARAHDGVRREDEQALAAERVQQFAVMADEQTDAAELAKTVDEQTPRRRVDMVRRFVQRKQFRLFPQGDGDLRAFPFTVAERVPTVMPIKRNVELAAPFIRLEVVGFKELMPVFRRIIRPLKDIDGRAELA